MVRISSSVTARQRKKKVLKQAKGQFGRRSKHYRQAIKSVIKGLTYSYRDRKVKKREFRSLWIIRINAACRESGVNYSRFIKGLSSSGITLNRKMLSEVAIHDPDAFRELVNIARDAKPAAA